MELTMGQRKAVTRASAVRYKRAGRAGNKIILDELCATGWHRDHSRKALRQTLKPTLVRPANWYCSTRSGCCSRR